MLIDLVHTTVNYRLFDGLQTILTPNDQLTEGKNEVRLQCQRIIILGIGRVDIHGVDIVGAGRTDFDNLALQTVDQGRVLRLRIADNDIIVGNQEGIGDLSLCGEGFTGTGRTEDQTVRVLQLLSIHHDQVVGEGIQAVIQGLIAILEQLLCGKGNKDRRRAGGQSTLDLDQVIGKRETAHEPLLLLKIQSSQVAVVLLRNGGRLKHVVLKLLLRLAGIHDKEGDEEHTLILRLQLLQKGLCILTVGGQVGRDNVHVITGTDCLFLLLNLAAVKLGNGVLDLLDGSGLVYRLDVHGDDLAGLHIQKILQKLVGKIRCCNLQITHGSVQAAHGKGFAAREGEGCGSNEVLHGKSGACQPAPVEVKTVSIAHVEHGMHQLQTFLPIEHPR